MKYLIVLLVVLAVLWLVRSGQRRDPPESGRANAPPQRPTPIAQPQDMIECPVCHVHLPRGEALPGPDGQLYCCVAHRASAGG